MGADACEVCASEEDAKLAQKLGQLQPSMAVFSHECVGPTGIVWANLTPFSVSLAAQPSEPPGREVSPLAHRDLYGDSPVRAFCVLFSRCVFLRVGLRQGVDPGRGSNPTSPPLDPLAPQQLGVAVDAKDATKGVRDSSDYAARRPLHWTERI